MANDLLNGRVSFYRSRFMCHLKWFKPNRSFFSNRENVARTVIRERYSKSYRVNYCFCRKNWTKWTKVCTWLTQPLNVWQTIKRLWSRWPKNSKYHVLKIVKRIIDNSCDFYLLFLYFNRLQEKEEVLNSTIFIVFLFLLIFCLASIVPIINRAIRMLCTYVLDILIFHWVLHESSSYFLGLNFKTPIKFW